MHIAFNYTFVYANIECYDVRSKELSVAGFVLYCLSEMARFRVVYFTAMLIDCMVMRRWKIWLRRSYRVTIYWVVEARLAVSM